MAETALKIDFEPEYVSARRVLRPDLQDKLPWLCKRIKERWPHLQDRQIFGWLVSCSDSNEYLFVRTNKAFALFQMQREFTEPYPWVREWFVFAETDAAKWPKDSDGERFQERENAQAIAEAASLYEDAKRWAEKICADIIEVANVSDVPTGDAKKPERDSIRGRLNTRMYKRETLFGYLGEDKVKRGAVV